MKTTYTIEESTMHAGRYYAAWTESDNGMTIKKYVREIDFAEARKYNVTLVDILSVVDNAVRNEVISVIDDPALYGADLPSLLAKANLRKEVKYAMIGGMYELTLARRVIQVDRSVALMTVVKDMLKARREDLLAMYKNGFTGAKDMSNEELAAYYATNLNIKIEVI